MKKQTLTKCKNQLYNFFYYIISNRLNCLHYLYKSGWRTKIINKYMPIIITSLLKIL